MINSHSYGSRLRFHSQALAVILSGIAFTFACGGGSAPGGDKTPPPETASISNTVAGPFDVAMSTSFQPAEWDYTLFQDFPSLTTTLGNLQPQHIRLQGISQGVPQGAAGSSSQTWNFTILDAITQPVLGVGDHSPEFQIAKAPPFMYVNNDSSQNFLDLTFQQFAGYTQNLVRYYDTGGFTANGTPFVSPAYANGETVTYWGIYNEPSINNNLSATDYVNMYNAVVPAMQSVDSSIKFVAMELCCGSEDWVTTFAQNVNAPVDVVAAHYYSSCNQKDTDAMLMSTVPGFVNSVQTIRNNLAINPTLASVPIWVTENNVNADFNAGNNMSNCNPGQTFVTDVRGASPFFAAWRPYVFSQFGKAGVQALYHWDFGADAQYGEVNASTGQVQLSYWVDYWLPRMFPSPPGASLLAYTASDNADLEVLPVLNGDGSVVVMVANHAVNSPQDNNGPGVTMSIQIDVSALGTFSNGSLLMIDANTSVALGPTPAPVTPASKMTIDFDGYGVAFLTLTP